MGKNITTFFYISFDIRIFIAQRKGNSTLDLENVNITRSKPPFKLRTHFIFSPKSFFVLFDSVF